MFRFDSYWSIKQWCPNGISFKNKSLNKRFFNICVDSMCVWYAPLIIISAFRIYYLVDPHMMKGPQTNIQSCLFPVTVMYVCQTNQHPVWYCRILINPCWNFILCGIDITRTSLPPLVPHPLTIEEKTVRREKNSVLTFLLQDEGHSHCKKLWHEKSRYFTLAVLTTRDVSYGEKIAMSLAVLRMHCLLVQPFPVWVISWCFCCLRSHYKTPCKVFLNFALRLAFFLAKFWVEFGTVARQLSP